MLIHSLMDILPSRCFYELIMKDNHLINGMLIYYLKTTELSANLRHVSFHCFLSIFMLS